MPLATATQSMDSKVQDIVNGLPQSESELQSWNAAQKWATVAEAFFGSAVIPSFTPLGLEAGKVAFVGAALALMASPQELNPGALAAGFTAFAAIAAVPGNVSPTPPVVHAPPAGPLDLTALSTLPASETTMPSTTALHGILLAWATTGTQTTPGTPPVVVPWS